MTLECTRLPMCRPECQPSERQHPHSTQTLHRRRLLGRLLGLDGGGEFPAHRKRDAIVMMMIAPDRRKLGDTTRRGRGKRSPSHARLAEPDRQYDGPKCPHAGTDESEIAKADRLDDHSAEAPCASSVDGGRRDTIVSDAGAMG